MISEQELERMVRENAGLVGTLVSRTLRLFPRLPTGYDRDDLQSLGYLGLVRAARSFDPGRGVAFSTYAYRCIETTIAGALKREADRRIDCISLSHMLGEEEDHPLEDQLADKRADAAAEALNSCERELVERAMAGLPAQQARVIRAIYFEGDTVVRVAEAWRMNAQAVQNLHIKALKSLRVRLKRLGVPRPEG